jgi:hypothetical protein
MLKVSWSGLILSRKNSGFASIINNITAHHFVFKTKFSQSLPCRYYSVHPITNIQTIHELVHAVCGFRIVELLYQANNGLLKEQDRNQGTKCLARVPGKPAP